MHAVMSVEAFLTQVAVSQSRPGCAIADEGSVLCLGPDEALGRIQEVFGPVHAPLYALSYAGGDSMPPAVTTGASVLAVERLSVLLSSEHLKMQQARGCFGVQSRLPVRASGLRWSSIPPFTMPKPMSYAVLTALKA